MTKAVHNRVLKDTNGDIGDHLRNHIHLTNCIHLKNHMHKQSPLLLVDKVLMRDLMAVQKSRSLRDPSASPSSHHSNSILDLLPKIGERDSFRKSVGNGRPLTSLGPSKVFPHEGHDVVAAISDRSDKSRIWDSRRIRREENSRASGGSRTNADDLDHAVSQNSQSKNSRVSRQKGKHSQGDPIKTLSEQLNDVQMDSDDLVSSNMHRNETSIRCHSSGVNRGKRRKFRGARRDRVRDIDGQSKMSVASNSFPHMEIEERHGDQSVTNGAPRNGCGIPWNWSKIHYQSKSIIDIAGRSLSCGLSDSRLKKDGMAPRGSDTHSVPVESDCSSSYTNSDVEALPLLVEPIGWEHDYSGELGIFADNLLKQDDDSALVSEARYGDQQNLTQKYMPKTFGDLVGQNLVAQALCNGIDKRKIGLLYVFYGPLGTGKSSCARIFAKALNCQSLEDPKPCGFCNCCRGKSKCTREVGSVSNFDFDSIMGLLESVRKSSASSDYRVLIFDDCDSLSSEGWTAITKFIDRAPRRVVFVFVCTNLDVFPHTIISRCHKFFFPKIKDADIIRMLQFIAIKEDIEIDKEALKLIASRSDGSLRDAEMTLEQLSLLGQKISVPLVQEMVGLISDEKLVDLLDFALSANTVRTVRNLRVIMQTGVDPLALMSQLATVITDILAGSYDATKERHKRKFFRHQLISKEDMEKLRQALKTLSEAEKQLRISNDKLTWLTAALLQLAPDQQYILPSSSANTSSNQSPLDFHNSLRGSKQENVGNEGGLLANTRLENYQTEYFGDAINGNVKKSITIERKRNVADGLAPQKTFSVSSDALKGSSRLNNSKGIEEIWLEVLEKIQISSLRQFMYQQGKLVSVSFGAAPTAQLMFSSHLTKARAEEFRDHILQAFKSVLETPVTIEIGYNSTKETSDINQTNPIEMETNEIVEVAADNKFDPSRERSALASTSGRRNTWEQSQSQSIVRSKVSLAQVIQQPEGCSNQSGWSTRKAVSIAEKLEQQNLKLEPRSKSLLCWKATRVTRRKLSRLKTKTRRPHSFLKLVSCGKCLSSRSPR